MKLIFPLVFFLLFSVLFYNSCSKLTISSIEFKNPEINTTLGFLPMQIGNYWKYNEENYTEITDTAIINDQKYYRFFSLTGGDGIGERFLRIDKENNLIRSNPNNPDFKTCEAKFNANVGETFFTLNDSSVNDFKVTVIEKNSINIQFEYERIFQDRGKHYRTYKKGIGWAEDYKEIKINGNIYRF